MIPSSENVARILSKEWFVKGELQHTAFKLANGESYLSVNRTAIETYKSDVEAFVFGHPKFLYSEMNFSYRRALLNVGDVRDIDVSLGEKKMKIDVEVEPRDTHTKSHAGIFTRFQNKNIKQGQLLKAGPTAEEISADTVLLEVRMAMLEMSAVEECHDLPYHHRDLQAGRYYGQGLSDLCSLRTEQWK